MERTFFKRVRDLFFSLRVLPLLSIALLIWITSSIPSSALPRYPIPHFDKIVHFAFYSLLALGFAYLPGKERWFRLRWRVFLFCLLGTALFGVLDEWRQSHVPGRVSSFFDWVVDFIAGLLVTLFYSIRLMLKQKKTGTPPSPLKR